MSFVSELAWVSLMSEHLKIKQNYGHKILYNNYNYIYIIVDHNMFLSLFKILGQHLLFQYKMAIKWSHEIYFGYNNNLMFEEFFKRLV